MKGNNTQQAMHAINYYPIFHQHADLSLLWDRVRECLQGHFRGERCCRQEQSARHFVQEFVHTLRQFPEFDKIMYTAQSEPRLDHPWGSKLLAYDDGMQIDLVTVFGDSPTPLHSYDGPAGVIFVVKGKLTVKRYRELNPEISNVSAISKLECRNKTCYQSSQCTLIDSTATPVVEIWAKEERGIFINIHLKDNIEHHHYFYYPCYQSSQQPQFFTRRIPAEW